MAWASSAARRRKPSAWARASSNARDAVYRFDGVRWIPYSLPTRLPLLDIAGSADGLAVLTEPNLGGVMVHRPQPAR